MPNKVVIFPEGKQTEAQAYLDWTNAEARNPFYPGDFGYIRNDAFGQWVVPFLGPPFAWNYIVVDEPEDGPGMRADGVLHDFAIWPDEEE